MADSFILTNLGQLEIELFPNFLSDLTKRYQCRKIISLLSGSMPYFSYNLYWDSYIFAHLR